MFTLPDVEVTIQKDLKFNRLRLSCHSYSFKGGHDLFNQKLGFFFTSNFRTRRFSLALFTFLPLGQYRNTCQYRKELS